jgi:hypothetical protein
MMTMVDTKLGDPGVTVRDLGGGHTARELHRLDAKVPITRGFPPCCFPSHQLRLSLDPGEK